MIISCPHCGGGVLFCFFTEEAECEDCGAEFKLGDLAASIEEAEIASTSERPEPGPPPF